MRTSLALLALGAVVVVVGGCGGFDGATAGDEELYDFVETTSTLVGGMPYDVYVAMMRDAGEQELAFAEAESRSLTLCDGTVHDELAPEDLAIVLAYCPELAPP